MTKLSRVGWTATLMLAILYLGACAPQKTNYSLNNPELLASIGASALEAKHKRIAAGKEGYMDSAYEYISAGELDKAIKECEEIRAIRPNDEDVYIAEGWAYLSKGEYATAANRFSSALAVDGTRSEAHYLRAWSYRGSGEYSKALEDVNVVIRSEGAAAHILAFYQALSIESKSEGGIQGDIYRLQARMYYRLKELDLAIASIDRAIPYFPSNGVYFSDRGQYYLEQQKMGPAYNDFVRAVELDPNLVDSWNLAGGIDLIAGRYASAVMRFQKAHEIDPQRVVVMTNYGLAYWLLGDQVKALELMGKAIRVGPNEHTYYHLAYFNHLNGRQNKARDYFVEASELNPEILTVRAAIYRQIPASSPTSKFYKDELDIASIYIETGKTPAQTAYEQRPPTLDITSVTIDPDPVARNQAFDFHIGFKADIPGLKEQVIKTVLSFEILRGDKTLLTSKPLYIEVDNGGAKRWTLHMNPVSAQGTYTLRVTIKYNDLISEKDTSLVIN